MNIDDVRAAAARIDGRVARTPVLHLEVAGSALSMKAEHRQRTGSFKVRGAFNALLAMPEAERARGVLAVSSGNHAQAVALAARELGVAATIVMPSGANPGKVQATRELGAEVISEGVTGENRERMVRKLASERGLPLVHPFDDELVMSGQGTAGLELTAQSDPLDVVIVPVGGGGLISGVATAVKDSWPDVRIVGVEPDVAADAQASLREGRIVSLARAPDTICDGVRALSVGERPWSVISRLVDEIVTVPDEIVLEAMRVLDAAGERVEPSGALPVAAVLGGGIRGPRIGVVLSGGNRDPRLIWS